MKLTEIVQKAVPGISDDMADYIIWNRTPFPFKKLTAREVYKAADRWKRAMAHGVYLCELCNNEARQDDWICSTCDRMLHTQMDDDK